MGFRTARPYATNAITKPSMPLMITDPVSAYVTCTHTKMRASIARTAAATTVSFGCMRSMAGTISPTTHNNSMIPRPVHAACGNAPKEGTSALTASMLEKLFAPATLKEGGDDVAAVRTQVACAVLAKL